MLTSPLLGDFLELARNHNNEWAKELTYKLRNIADNETPDIWTIQIDDSAAPTIIDAINGGEKIRIGHVTSDPRKYGNQLNCLPLLLKRGDKLSLLPQVEESIQIGDQILFCGDYGIAPLIEWTLQNYNTLRYVTTGETRPDGYIWRWLARREQ